MHCCLNGTDCNILHLSPEKRMQDDRKMKIEKLLFINKFDELWFDALQSSLDLRKSALNHVVFLNVIERDRVAMRRGSGYHKEEEIKLKEKANRYYSKIDDSRAGI